MLARFDHPSLVKVYRFWEANGTAYMVMPYYPRQTLQDVRRAMSAPPDEAWLRAVLEPLLDALERAAREGVYHRDIAPDNILLLPDGRPVLLDFGAARRVIGDSTQALTVILKPGYAPIEQYADDAGHAAGAVDRPLRARSGGALHADRPGPHAGRHACGARRIARAVRALGRVVPGRVD